MQYSHLEIEKDVIQATDTLLAAGTKRKMVYLDQLLHSLESK